MRARGVDGSIPEERAMRAFGLILVGIAVTLGGCDRDYVRIVVTPKVDGAFERVVTVWRESAEKSFGKPKILAPPDTLLAAPRKVYGKAEETPGPEVVFRGVFRETPADLEDEGRTNRGGYDVCRSRLGTSHYYRERLPGRTDIHRIVVDIGVLVDAATEVAAVMAEEQLAGEKGVEKLAATLRGSLGTDIKDILTLFVVSASAIPRDLGPDEDSRENGEISATAYVLQLLEERGYVRLDTLPRALDENDLEKMALRWAARVMDREPDASLRRCFAFIGDEDRLQAAFESAIAKAGLDKEDLEERGSRVLGGLVGTFFGMEPTVELAVRSPVEPFATNGRWSASEKATRFEACLNGHSILPPLAYAAWSVPDAAWQRTRLGKVAVTGEALAEVAFWETGLPERERAAWLAALDALDREGDIEAQLRAIRLTDAKREEPVRGAAVILKALGFEGEAEPK
jgi:hypothetical protein